MVKSLKRAQIDCTIRNLKDYGNTNLDLQFEIELAGSTNECVKGGSKRTSNAESLGCNFPQWESHPFSGS